MILSSQIPNNVATDARYEVATANLPPGTQNWDCTLDLNISKHRHTVLQTLNQAIISNYKIFVILYVLPISFNTTITLYISDCLYGIIITMLVSVVT